MLMLAVHGMNLSQLDVHQPHPPASASTARDAEDRGADPAHALRTGTRSLLRGAGSKAISSFILLLQRRWRRSRLPRHHFACVDVSLYIVHLRTTSFCYIIVPSCLEARLRSRLSRPTGIYYIIKRYTYGCRSQSNSVATQSLTRREPGSAHGRDNRGVIAPTVQYA